MAETLKLDAAPLGGGSQVRDRRHASQPASTPTAIVLSVEGMHCGGCMRKVETALGRLPGVVAARANLSARRVQVHRDADGPSVDTLINALADVGFKSGEVADTSEPASQTVERDLLKRLAVAGFAMMNIMLLSISVWSGRGGDMSHGVESLFHWVSALIALPTVAYSGVPFFKSAAGALAQRRLNMDVPISLGVLLATAMSLYLTITGGGLIYFDAAVGLLFFLLIGRFLDTRMRVRAAGAASNLLALQGLSANVVAEDGTISRMSARELSPGMRVLVAPGERIPVDGTVISGGSDVDNSVITGESMPIAAEEGTDVFAGAVNLSASLTVRANAVEGNTVLAEIARLMAVAEQSRGQYVQLADRAAKIYAPAVHILGAATFIGWLMFGFSWEPALTAAIAVLIITCPCALALAVPAVQVAATGRLFDRGVIVKSADGFERLSDCDAIVFDKTGTLTTGVPELIFPDDEAGMVALVRAATLAAHSRHPYSEAIVAGVRAQGLEIKPGEDVREHPGAGLSVSDEVGEWRLGSAAFCNVPDAEQAASAIWFRAPDGETRAFQFREILKPDAIATARDLKAAGYRLSIISGDHPAAVENVANALGIEDWTARCTPAGKVAHLKRLADAGAKVLMVGDGLNDAPALASGHASMSPSSAADISQTAADVVFQGDGIHSIVDALATANKSKRMAIENFMIALGYNAIFVPIAVIGLVTPLIAAIAMSASSIAVTGNAVRLRTRKTVELRR
jgi:Cu2+-exporting ATPase